PQDLASYVADLQARDPFLANELQQSGAINNLAQSFPQLQDIGQRVGSAFRSFQPAEAALGVQTPELKDVVQYVMRRQADIEGPRAGEGVLNYLVRRGKQLLDTSHTSQAAREEILKGFPGGTTQINDIVKALDPNSGESLLVGPNRTLNDLQGEAYLRKQLT